MSTETWDKLITVTARCAAVDGGKTYKTVQLFRRLNDDFFSMRTLCPYCNFSNPRIRVVDMYLTERPPVDAELIAAAILCAGMIMNRTDGLEAAGETPGILFELINALHESGGEE